MSSNRGAEHAPWCPEDAVVGHVVVIEAALQLTMLGLVRLPRQRRRYRKEMQNESLYRVRECSVRRENRGWAASARRLDSGKWKVILQAAIEKVDWSGDDGNMDHEEDHSGGAFGPRSLIEIW